MKILHLSAVKSWGGGGNHIENLYYELSLSHPEIENTIVVAKNGRFHERLKKGNFNYDTLYMKFKMDPRAIFKLIKLCRREKYDLIHIHGSTSLTLAVIAHKIFKLPPFILSKKTSFPIKNRWQTLYKYNHTNIKKILCVSEATKKITAESIEEPSKLVTIYHGTRIDNKDGRPSFLIRKKLNLSEETILIGNIGNHIRAKNLETLLLTANYLVNEMNKKNFHFVQIGRFSARTKALKLLVEKHNLISYFSFFDFIPNAQNLIPQFDLKIMTSQSEGLPQVIYEAFYHKVPVISTNVGGIPEIISHGKNGLLTDPFDFKKLAEHIVSLSENEEQQLAFTETSYELLVNNFTSKIMAQKTLEAYKKVLNGEF
ncbi:MAG TPA: glycosyltransferase family 4 protein [Salinimicrobium sp.]|nr:glycosyltransferase family 4 protein [Salinimicrobium sp.]